MDEILKKLHKLQLEMAKEVDSICREHNIKYFIIAGTLLGAVRHKGFIPWDDDLDIGMLREDYEKFIKICSTELSSDYFLQTWDNDPNFGLPIAKIRKNDTKYIEKASRKIGIHSGIYIDIFPFDNVPENFLKESIQNINTYILKRLILARVGYDLCQSNKKIKKLTYKIIKLISKILSLSRQKQMLEKQMKKFNNSKTTKVVTFGGSYGYKKESIKRVWVENLSNIEFENTKLICPRDYKSYLTYFYGDYFTPPPENERYNRHRGIEVRFKNKIQ
ncbi:MAG: LicD family protein [Candidatus Helarchaeota archaeon]